ncbi:MAG: thiamine phosphate synthase, partial [Lachnospiraceae bacterium]
MEKLDLTLYLVTDRGAMTEEEFLNKVEAACAGGVTLVQLREKECDSLTYYHLAQKLKKVTDAFGIPLIIDDRIDIALAVDAAGVHVGKSDIPVAVARTLM